MNALALLATVTGVSIAAAALMLRVDEPKSPANTLDALVESSKDAHSDEKNKKGDSMTATKEKKISVSRAGFDLTHLSQDKINTLAARLSTEESRVLLGKGTERAFCGNLLDNKLKGAYLCKLCGLPLFASNAKFDSGTGWPSFFQPFDKDHIAYHKDTSLGMERVEIDCARCGGHLGHVFDDGPRPTGLRYCLNSASLDFSEQDKDGNIPFTGDAQPIKMQTAYFAGGCFWGVEDRFQQLPGVISAVSGYQGGKVRDPDYKLVCTGTTDHAETVKIDFDPTKITYTQLLEKFFKFHDPTQLNRQGPDFGTQYRSAIFAADDEQLKQAQAFIAEQAKSEKYKSRKIVTQVTKVADVGKFYPAEEYHQDYHEKHGGSCPLPE